MKNTNVILGFKEWVQWFRILPIYLKLFALIVLLRPVIDNFYELKNISIFVSPLYWVGALTPLLAIIAIIRLKKIPSLQDHYLNVWFGIVFLSSFFLVFNDGETTRKIEFALKLTAPFFIYALCRRMVYSQQSFAGLLTTFFYACLIAFAFIIYESIAGPITVQVSRGLERAHGGFADVMNYAIYLIYGLAILLYSFMNRGNQLYFFGFLVLIAIGLLSIKHTTTFFAVFALLGVFTLMARSHLKLDRLLVFVIVVGVIAFFYYEGMSDTLSMTLEREREVLAGTRPESQMFHGRMSRWQWLWGDFLNQPLWAQLFGYPLSGNASFHIVGINVHNDFFRIIFLSGFVGFVFYLLFLIKSVHRAMGDLDKSKRFLSIANLLIIAVYSVTTLPFFYANMLYPIMIIFAYTALPLKVRYPDEQKD